MVSYETINGRLSVHYDDVKPSVFTLIKEKDEEIIDLSEILKKMYNLFLIW